MDSYDFVTADKFGKNGWPLVLEFGYFWTRFGPLAKSRSGNPVFIYHTPKQAPGTINLP